VHVPEDARKRVEELLPDSKASSFIGLCPSARHATKIWLQGRFAETAVELARRASCNIILFGSGDEIDRCSAIEELIRKQESSVSVYNMAGKISLLETAAAMDFCRVVISNDSGLMHLAAARKRPVVAIFGSTVRELGFFPFGTRNTVVENMNVECRPCSHIGRAACPKGHFRCMQDIQSTQVIEAASQLLEVEQEH
jgi:heptosyltransferase-2